MVLFSSWMLLLGILAFCLCWRQPFNASALIGLSLVVFFLMPILIVSQFCGECFRYPFSIVGIVNYHDKFSGEDVFVLLLIVSAVVISSLLGDLLWGNKKKNAVVHKESLSPRSGSIIILLFVYALLLAYVQLQLPSFIAWLAYKRHLGETASPYVVGFLVEYFPAVLVMALVAVRGRVGRDGVLLSAIALILAYFGGGRANVLSILMLIVVAKSLFSRESRASSSRSKYRFYDGFKKMTLTRKLALSVLGLSLIPFLWWIRGRRHAVQEDGWGVALDFAVNRSFLEVLFGSGASGGASFLLVKEYIDAEGFVWGGAFVRSMAMLVPRAIWPSKPTNLDTEIQDVLGLWTSPSVFLPNELYVSFYGLSPFFAFLLGLGLSYCYHRARLGGEASKLSYCCLYGSVIVLYKNGLVVAFPHFIMLFSLVSVVFWWLSLSFRVRRGS